MSDMTKPARVPERRRAPRVNSRLPVILTDAAREIIAYTRNISASGAYCTLRRFIAPMTKLQVRVEIPGRSTSTRIVCRGVVVRTDPPTATPRPSRCHVAIFFNELTDGDRVRLARYVQQQLHVTKPRVTNR